MLKAYDIKVQYLGETGYAFQRRYDLTLADSPYIPLMYQERSTSKYAFKGKKCCENNIIFNNRDFMYNLLCGKALRRGDERQGCMVGVPVRVKLWK